MPALVTANATILCSHGGRVTIMPGQAAVGATGAPVLCEPDLMGAPIIGCPVAPSPGTKPCTTVISTLPGSFSPKVTAGGRPVYLSTLTGMTDGVPPGMISVIDPGAPLVQA